MEERFKLSPPWDTYMTELSLLFEEDPEVHAEFDRENYRIKLFVDNQAKYEALEKLLPTEKDFGNVKVYIDVIPADVAAEEKIDLISAAFKDNPVLSFIETVQLFDTPIHYVVFKNKVVQFFNDQLDDVHGVKSTLYQEIAKEILGQDSCIYYCTDVPDEMKGDGEEHYE